MQWNKPKMLLSSRKLATIVLLSSLGGLSSMLVGNASGMLSIIPIGPFVAGQLLAGIHVIWLILAEVLTQTRGAATMTGIIKGIVETLLPNHLGPLVFLISLFEGLVVEAVFAPSRKVSPMLIYVAGGLSSASNVMIIQTFLLPTIPLVAIVSMYVTSLCSGLIFGGFLSRKIAFAFQRVLPNLQFNQTKPNPHTTSLEEGKA